MNKDSKVSAERKQVLMAGLARVLPGVVQELASASATWTDVASLGTWLGAAAIYAGGLRSESDFQDTMVISNEMADAWQAFNNGQPVSEVVILVPEADNDVDADTRTTNLVQIN